MRDQVQFIDPKSPTSYGRLYRAERNRIRREQMLRFLGSLAFAIFLLAQLFSLTRTWFVLNIDPNLNEYATLASAISIIPLLAAALCYGSIGKGRFLERFVPFGKAWFILLSVTTTFALIYGLFFQANETSSTIRDFIAFFIIVLGIVLGSEPTFWKDSYVTLLITLLTAVFINALGFSNLDSLILRYGYEARIGVETTSYELQGALGWWVLFVLIAPFRSRKLVGIAAVVAAFVLLQQLLFQKRIGVTYALSVIGISLFLLPKLANRFKLRTVSSSVNTNNRQGGVVLFLALITVSLLVPELVRGQTDSLIRRYLSQDVSRVEEAIHMVEDFNPSEYLLGRGMGGAYTFDEIRFTGLGVWDGNGVFVRRHLHMGALMPFLKGGMVLSLVYYVGVTYVLFSWTKNRDDPLSVVSYIIIALITLKSLVGGMFLLPESYDLILIGCCFGRCLTRPYIKSSSINNWLSWKSKSANA
ncbi:MAG: hypothetical protein M9928_03405 [Anaerolineae bacterium]|nr:hypothetical protein [Anaerolineae bacterium]MCO5204052.1 hypothetical protein [Anaerolineae bacterium]